MAEVLSRRGFVRGGLLASVASATGGLVWNLDLFCSPNGAKAIVDLVMQTLNLDPQERVVVEQFVQSLQTGIIEQTENEEFVNGLLESLRQSEDVLARYVVGEFVARTNYFEFAAGIDKNLKIFDGQMRLDSVV